MSIWYVDVRGSCVFSVAFELKSDVLGSLSRCLLNKFCAQTGGRVIILGKTGRNFAAGMSGGIAYVLDEAGDLERMVNKELVSLCPVTNGSDDATFLRETIQKHFNYTNSHAAKRILADFDAHLSKMVKVFPNDYRYACAWCKVNVVCLKCVS